MKITESVMMCGMIVSAGIFLFDGTDNVFRFAFAVGVMGSMIFSILALVIFLPVFGINFCRDDIRSDFKSKNENIAVIS